MPQTKLNELADFGQSMWLDYISRPLLESGKLKELIATGLRGMTSNPTIFNQSISLTKDYDEKIIQLHEKGKSTFEIYDDLTIRDVQQAADFFKPVYEKTNGLDGYVSLEINPKLAMNSAASIQEGKRLFQKTARCNVLIKVPSTHAGFAVIEEFLASGIPVNVTLIFSLDQYKETVKAFLKGLNRYWESGGDLSKLQSVASVFVSRIDTTVDKLLAEKIIQTKETSTKNQLEALKGKAAVANCKLIFEQFSLLSISDAFKSLARNKAQIQRVLWASTGTKNPQYSDLKYVTELIATSTVNTVPQKTLEAFLDHGELKSGLLGTKNDAKEIINTLNRFGIDLTQVCDNLLKEGVVAFEKSFDELLNSIEAKIAELCSR